MRPLPIRPADLDHVRAVAAGTRPPAAARLAATVALLRNGAAGLEVYLMRRQPTLAFAAGMYVFPGGAFEPGDGTVAAAGVRETEEECGVRLDPAQLVPVAHWVTPELQPKRFDTHFFAAALPGGQECVDVGGEADVRLWISPADALTRAATGELSLMPPTLAVLGDLARFDDVASALGAERRIVTVQPVLRLVGDHLEFET
ncbi:NUDIX hydrolase, partial [Spongisporangium articulatum]